MLTIKNIKKLISPKAIEQEKTSILSASASPAPALDYCYQPQKILIKCIKPFEKKDKIQDALKKMGFLLTILVKVNNSIEALKSDIGNNGTIISIEENNKDFIEVYQSKIIEYLKNIPLFIIIENDYNQVNFKTYRNNYFFYLNIISIILWSMITYYLPSVKGYNNFHFPEQKDIDDINFILKNNKLNLIIKSKNDLNILEDMILNDLKFNPHINLNNSSQKIDKDLLEDFYKNTVINNHEQIGVHIFNKIIKEYKQLFYSMENNKKTDSTFDIDNIEKHCNDFIELSQKTYTPMKGAQTSLFKAIIVHAMPAAGVQIASQNTASSQNLKPTNKPSETNKNNYSFYSTESSIEKKILTESKPRNQ